MSPIALIRVKSSLSDASALTRIQHAPTPHRCPGGTTEWIHISHTGKYMLIAVLYRSVVIRRGGGVKGPDMSSLKDPME